MAYIGYPCDICKHKLPVEDGWKPVCHAFPKGIPDELLFKTDPRTLPECSGGIKFEFKDTKINRVIRDMMNKRDKK